MIMHHPRNLGLGSLLLGMLVTAGCSNPTVGTVAGKVTLGGQPLAEGSVVFEDRMAGISVQAPLASDGTYTVRTYDRDGLPPGAYQVAVTPTVASDGETPLAIEGKDPPPPSPIPAKYRSVKTSGLTATVKAGDNPPFDFDLVP